MAGQQLTFSMYGAPGDEIHGTYTTAKNIGMQVASAFRSKMLFLSMLLADAERGLTPGDTALLNEAASILAQTQFIRNEKPPEVDVVQDWFIDMRRRDIAKLLGDGNIVMLLLMITRAREHASEQNGHAKAGG